MLIISSLALNAFVQSSTSFNKDKKSIDSSQNMTVILDLIGSDIRQSGENIGLNKFPTIEFKEVAASETSLKSGSSKIIIRRALTEPLTLCQSIAASANLATTTSLFVADNTPVTVVDSANCNVGTATSQLFAARPSTEYDLVSGTDTPPTPNLSTADFILPKALRKVRDYRCKLDDINPTVPYDDPSRSVATFCNSLASEKTRIAVANGTGQFLTFNQTNETLDSGNTATLKKYGITINTSGLDTITAANNTKNNAVAYAIGDPIYVIEERVYTLTSDGALQVSVNGASPETLIKKIENFRVSARVYTNSIDRIVNHSLTAIPTTDACGTVAVPFAAQPATGSESSPKYICKFNYYTGVATTDQADWKTLAGIKVEIQAKYDGSGGAATPTNDDRIKLYSAAEFFPRNVLSR